MEAKLIKSIQEMFVQYHLKNENGHTIATTLFPIPTEVEYAANGRGITLQRLSLKNCQAIERGYDLDELAKTIFPDKMFTTNEEYEIPIDGFPYQWGFKVGFQKALELMGDNKFSEQDVKNIFAKTLENAPSTESHTRMISDVQYRHFVMDELYDRITKSPQQTEWDVEVEIDEEKEFIFDPAMGISQGHYLDKPKLDADGCLILKKITNEN